MPGPKFTEADYDFSGIPPAELEACCFYEFARESKAAMREVAADREAQKQSEGKTRTLKFGPCVKNTIQTLHLASLSSVAGFPKTPWLSLPDKERDIILKHFFTLPYIAVYTITASNPPLAFATKEAGSTTLDMWIEHSKKILNVSNDERIVYGFFRVNMKYGHEMLVEEFARHLRTFEGKPMLEYPPVPRQSAKKPPGRKSIHDTLNALGVLRLRYYCNTFAEAQKKMQPTKDTPYGMFYERRDGANRACNLALKHFKLAFGWLDSESPIHFTKGWRGGL